VLDITGNGAIDVLIGLAFFFFLLSVVCSAINEAIATVLNLRAKELEKGIISLLGSKGNAAAVYDDPRVKALFKPRLFGIGDKKPSYIAPRVFALAVLDAFAKADPPAKDPASEQAADQPEAPAPVLSFDLKKRAENALADFAMKAQGAAPPGNAAAAPENPAIQPKEGAVFNDHVAKLLQDALDEARVDVLKLRGTIENSFNEAMDRVSGWYKRRVQLILFLIALVVVGVANADSFAVGKTLWQNDAVRSAVVSQANTVVQNKNQIPDCAKTKSGSEAPATQAVASCIAKVKQLGLPIGWTGAPSLRGRDIPGKIGGLLLTAFAILLGAPFWFDALGKLAGLKGAGQAPGDKNSNTTPQPNA
jgi:hypothetical protein